MTNNLKRNQEAIELCLKYSDEPEKLRALIEGLEVEAEFKAKELYFERSEQTNVWNIYIKRQGKKIKFTYSDSINNTRLSQLLRTPDTVIRKYDRIACGGELSIDCIGKDSIQEGIPPEIKKVIDRLNKWEQKSRCITMLEADAFKGDLFETGKLNNRLVIKYGKDYYNKNIKDAQEKASKNGIDAQKNILPSLYDILCCCRFDVFVGDFKDFCSEYGYNEDSIKDNKLYTRVIEQTNKLLTIFSLEDIEVLPG